MDKRPNIPKQQSGNPSKILTAAALIIAFSLPYYLVNNFAHHKQKEDTQQIIALPKQTIPLAIPAPNILEITRKSEPIKAPPPENTNTLVKTISVVKTAPLVKDNEWQTIKPRSGDTMAAIFKRLGLTPKNLHAVIDKNPNARALTNIKPNQEIQFLINKNVLEKLVIQMNNIQTLTVYRDGAKYKNKIDSKKMISQDRYVTGIVNGSLYSTTQRLNIPNKLVQQMTAILRNQIDFSHSIKAGDQFSIIYTAHYIEDKMVNIGDIQAVSFTNRGKTYQAVRHNKANGSHEYYTPQGTSLSVKKVFSRYPIRFSHISSTFAPSRYHPILQYKRAHKGIDLAAPIGTPIQATGDGVITIIDRHNGYGNMIKIKHDNTYSSIYGHMLKFQKGLSKGSKVKRGQVIGYVGQTGLATGPHCHYELHVKNEPRNPTTTPLPTATPISGRELAGFKVRAGTMLARLKLYEQTNIASTGKKNTKLG